MIDGEERRPEALFIRYDVFTSMADPRRAPAFRALAWYTVVSGWAIAHPEVRMFNRESALHVTNKLHVLHVAREVGLDIPETLVTNDHALLTAKNEREPLICKPVNGGDYTRELPDILKTAPHREGSLSAPSFVQERLVPPEVRVYSIGGRFFAFQLVADALDYRSTSDCTVVPIDETTLPSSLFEGLSRLMERLGMDYGAADFKACPETGALRFLEINNGPMFAAFDNACGGRLTRAMAEHLSAP
jgi:glutathione synthase/RimK-type ligase-like ATP-grasp enzyme